MSGGPTLPIGAVLAAALTGCGLTPLSNRIRVGEEPFVIGIGDGADGFADLYAASAGGGGFIRLTYTRAVERTPKLSPDGTAVAFFRAGSGKSAASWSLVILDLRDNAEASVVLPAGSGSPERIGWSRDGSRVVAAAGKYLVTAAPPGTVSLSPVSADSLPAADSATRELLGSPPRAEVHQCMDGGMCILAPGGELTLLGATTSGAIRWGADSVGYFTGPAFEVRPLAGGRSRHPDWRGAPGKLRELTYHPGLPPKPSAGPPGLR